MLLNRTLGGIFLVAGTSIGGGMLALPLTSAALGLGGSIALLCLLWAGMAYTSCLTVEALLPFPKGTNFSSLTCTILGPWAQRICLCAVGGLFYSLLAAYFTASSVLLQEALQTFFLLKISPAGGICTVAALLGLLVAWRSSVADGVNKILFIMMAGAFLVIVWFLFPHVILPKNLMNEPPNLKAVALALPVFFTSFGFHGSIPSLMDYVGRDGKKLLYIFILGSLIPLGTYIFWEIGTLTILPAHALNQLLQGGSVNSLIKEMSQVSEGNILPAAFSIFSEMALLTSMLGVGWGLFDFFQDILQNFKVVKEKPTAGRWMIGFLTFIPPVLFACFYPDGFIKALSFGGVFLAILAVLLPSAMVVKQRLSGFKGPYQTPGGLWGVGLAILMGLSVICAEMWTSFFV